jgi:diguanylate cyclase (GGDEF)-like protein/PAS domain S-box-containing protein
MADQPDSDFYLQLLRAYLDSANDGIFVLCDEMKFHVSNRQMQQWLGMSEEVLTRHNQRLPITHFITDPESLAIFRRAFERAVAGEPARFECRLAAPQAPERRVEVSLSRVALETGTLLIGVARDTTERQRLDELLAGSDEEWLVAMDFIEDAIYLVDLDDRVVRANRAFYALTGRTPETTLGRDVVQVMHPRGEAEPCPVCTARRARRDAYVTMEADHPDNPTGRPIEVMVRTLRNSRGEPLRVLMGMRDLTRLRQTEEALRLRLRAMEASVNAIVITNHARPGFPIEYVNPAFERITGYSVDEVLGRTTEFLYRGESDQSGIQALRAAEREQREAHVVLRNYRKDGTPFWNDLHIAPVRDTSGRVTHYVGILNDVTDARRYQAELEHHSTHDSLTGLANRALLTDRLSQAMAFATRQGRLAAVAILDLDRFKLVNDSLGHKAGDRLLQEVGRRLLGCVREGDTVARLGGDEFVLVLNDQADIDYITFILQRVLQAVRAPVTIDGRDLYVTASIGVSLYPGNGDDEEALLRNADTAMYRAKEQGSDNFQFYTADMNALVSERLLLETGLRTALERDELLLHYQPLVELATGRAVAAEALVRWQHPQLGLVPPGRFVPLAEETGLIVPIGEWVLREACRQAQRWREAGFAPLRVSVNLSARQLRHGGIVRTVADLLAEIGLPAQQLEVEITESQLIENPETAAIILGEFRDMGVRVVIDDFGVGYSSLSYLKRLPIDVLKIDQSFARGIPADRDGAAIAGAIIAMAHSLGIQVVAEGVETAEQLEFYRAQRCDLVQGYWLGRPAAAGTFAANLGGLAARATGS